MRHAITQADCQGFHESLLASGLSAKTCRRYLKSVHPCFSRARKLVMVWTNPAALVKTPVASIYLRALFDEAVQKGGLGVTAL